MHSALLSPKVCGLARDTLQLEPEHWKKRLLHVAFVNLPPDTNGCPGIGE